MFRNTVRTLVAAATLTVLVVAEQTAIVGQQREHVDVPRDQWQRVADVFAELGATTGAHIADIGAGSGYFTTRLSKAVGVTGRVYAVDVNPVSLRELRAAVTGDYPNVEIVRGEENDPRLPPARLDAALIVNAYHEFAEYQAMLEHLRAALKPGGRLVLVEPIPRASDTTRPAQAKRHTIAIELVESELQQAGFEVIKKDPAFVTRPGHVSGQESRDATATDWLLVARKPAGEQARAAARRDQRPSLDQR